MPKTSRNTDSLTRKIVRIIGLAVAVQALVLCLVVRASYTRTNEAIMSLAAQMLRYPDARHQDRPRRIRLNGLPLHFTSGSTHQPVSSVLDYVHAKCREQNGTLAEQLDILIKKGRKLIDRRPYSLVDGVLRYGNEKQGFVGCLARDSKSLNPDDTVKRIRGFLETGDVSRIGELRYVMAERHQETTSFIAFWTEGSANLFTLFPQGGDAPGHDLPGIPRPHDSRRVLSAWELGQSLALAVYVSPHSVLSNLMTSYNRQLEKDGWQRLNGQPHTKRPEETAFVAEKAGMTAQFEFSLHGSDKTAVTIVKMN